MNWERRFALVPPTDDWDDRAACKGMPTEWWYAEQGTAVKMPAGMRRALYTCWNKCPVREQCLRHALRQPEHWGIWGGAEPTTRNAPYQRKTYPAVEKRARERAEALGLVERSKPA